MRQLFKLNSIYIGYGKLNEMDVDEYIEVYHEELDPEEMFNLADTDRVLTEGLRTEVMAYLARENMAYQ